MEKVHNMWRVRARLLRNNERLYRVTFGYSFLLHEREREKLTQREKNTCSNHRCYSGLDIGVKARISPPARLLHAGLIDDSRACKGTKRVVSHEREAAQGTT